MKIQSIIKDMALPIKLQTCTDSSAAKGIASRRGLGKVRHIEVNQLWVQEIVADGSIELTKVDGASNLPDVLTKHVGREILEKHMQMTSQVSCQGRHPMMPTI